MKDVVAVLGEWDSDGPLRVELVARGIEGTDQRRIKDNGLKAMAEALASCPHFTQRAAPVSVEVGSENDSLAVSLTMGAITVHFTIRAEAERIDDNADVQVYEHVD